MVRLKACPSCGCRIVYFGHIKNPGKNKRFYAVCDDCGFRIESTNDCEVVDWWNGGIVSERVD